MTRELKLALIVGFALVLVVTVLISDHLSHASQTRIATLPADPARLTEPEPIATLTVDATPEPITLAADYASPQGIPLTGSGALSEPGPVIISQGARSTQPTPTLDEAVRSIGGRIDNGQIHLPGGPGMALINTRTEPLPGSLTPAPVRPVAIEVPAALPPTPADRIYTVADGESFFRICKQQYGDGKLWRKLVKYNGLSEAAPLKVGQKLRVPTVDVLNGKPAAAQPAAAVAAVDRVVPIRTAANQTVTNPASPVKTRTYTVRKGDTLAAIAQRELGSVRRSKDIIEANRKILSDPDNVPLGAVLVIPG